MWFDDWQGIARVIMVGLAAYMSLIVLLRVSGKRTLSKLNAFDLIVTVALGSTLATILLSKDVALAEGATAFAVLIGGQYAIAKLSISSAAVRGAVKSEPRVLVFRGEVLHSALRDERVTQDELDSVVRGAGLSSLADVGAVVLETDGSFHVIASLGRDLSSLPGHIADSGRVGSRQRNAADAAHKGEPK